MIISGATVIAQSDSSGSANFTYDNSGNLTKREVVYYESSKKSTKVDKEVPEEILQEEGFKVYPNPATSSLFVTLTREALEEDRCMIYMYDNLGKLIVRTETHQAINRIDVSSLEDGTYILKLVYGRNHHEWLIIKN
jgi:hypothetical protein